MRSIREYAGEIYSDVSIIRIMLISHLSDGILQECCRHGTVMSLGCIRAHRGGPLELCMYLCC